MELGEAVARAGERVLIRQDGICWTARDILARADDLARRIAGLGRVAVVAERCEAIAAALLACEQADVELLLLRSAAVGEWGVAVVLNEALQVVSSPGRAAKAGFGVLLTTSGTTGTPKLARHSKEKLLGRIRTAPASESVRWLLTYHPASFAGLQVLLTALVSGSEIAAVSAGSVPELAAAALEARPTHISGTPTFWRAFLMALGSRAAALPLRQITLGGELVDQQVLDRLRTMFPQAGVTHIYASTEAGALFAVKDGRAGFPARWLAEEVDGVALRISEGALEVRSPRAMLGYAGGGASPWLEDGWLRTGDLVELTGDRVYFRGRQDSMISVGGAKLTPEEVEAVLLEVPGVHEVRVFGIRNPITGQIVGAEIVAEPGVSRDELRTAVVRQAAARLAPYKVPRSIRFVESMALSQAGKKARTE
jgi:acyl-CoA synthetase (AMP-forming)/AMP-acid ligase II